MYPSKIQKKNRRYSNTEFEWNVLVAAFDADDDEAEPSRAHTTAHSISHFTYCKIDSRCLA